MAEQTTPLEGVKVLEFSQIIAGPLGCQLLADLGASVIKVEPIEGEPARLTTEFVPKEAKSYISLNRGKDSLALDLASEEAQQIIHRLIPEIDIVVINYRPDVAARLRVDYETLSAINPRLIYVDSTAFGRAGDWAGRPGYDIIVQAASGLMTSVGKTAPDGRPLPASAFADLTTGHAICSGALAALVQRGRTGEGQMVETSLLSNALILHHLSFLQIPAVDAEERAFFMATLNAAREEGLSHAEVAERLSRRAGRGAVGNVYYRTFTTADGVIAVGALSKSLREKVRQAVGFEHNRDEPDYDPGSEQQVRTDAEVTQLVEEIFRSQTTAFWDERLSAGGVPAAPVLFVQELPEHPQVVANEYAVEVEHDLLGPVLMQAPPWKMSKADLRPQRASPPLGRDTDVILARLGYAADEIDGLREQGVIR